jgi:hypothetical protein
MYEVRDYSIVNIPISSQNSLSCMELILLAIWAFSLLGDLELEKFILYSFQAH